MKDYNEIAKLCIEGKLFGTFIIEENGFTYKKIRYISSIFIKKSKNSKYPFILLNKLDNKKCDEIAAFNNDLSELGFFKIINFCQNIIIK